MKSKTETSLEVGGIIEVCVGQNLYHMLELKNVGSNRRDPRIAIMC